MSDENRFFSSFFTVPKKNGERRPIVNLNLLNKFVVYHQFKMENLCTVKQTLQEGDWMLQADLKDAPQLFAIQVCQILRTQLVYYSAMDRTYKKGRHLKLVTESEIGRSTLNVIGGVTVSY